jgi:hypothetical protein
MAQPRTSRTLISEKASGESRFATVIPLHERIPSDREARRISVSLSMVQPNSAYFVGPLGLDTSHYAATWPTVEFVGFDPENFKDVSSYNRWMLTPELYRRFAAYEFILVCQADAILVKPLPADEVWEFDYLGAPWIPTWVVGWDPFRMRLTGRRTGLRD